MRQHAFSYAGTHACNVLPLVLQNLKLPVAFHKQLKIRLLIVFIIDIVMHCKHLLNKRNIPVNRHCMYVCIQK